MKLYRYAELVLSPYLRPREHTKVYNNARLTHSRPAMKVAVVGAGISGVVAGAHLKAAGIDTTVFERSSQAGGVW